jgi:Amt family ammonium transporter
MSIALPNIPVYNASIPDGGNPLEVDVNAPYLHLEFHMVYQLIMGGLVFLIIPGIGLLYGGMARRKSSLAMIFQSMTIMSLCTVQWIFWGYSLSFSRTGHGHFIGDMSNFVLWNVNLSSIIPTMISADLFRSCQHPRLAPQSSPKSSSASTRCFSAPAQP